MKLLALDTSTAACSAAVWVDGVVNERFQFAPRGHAELILPMATAVLAEAGLSIRQLDALAVGRGPGAFTGVRIAVAVAQGIAFAADLPVVPVSTLAAVAVELMRQRRQVTHVAVALDARLGEIYWGTYRAELDDGAALWGEERVCIPTAATLPGPADWQGAGDGWAVHTVALRRLGIGAWRSDLYPHARAIATLGALAYGRGESVSAEQALPVYLRDKVVGP